MLSNEDIAALDDREDKKRQKTTMDDQEVDQKKSLPPSLRDVKTILHGIRGITSTGGPFPSLPSAPALTVKDVSLVATASSQ